MLLVLVLGACEPRSPQRLKWASDCVLLALDPKTRVPLKLKFGEPNSDYMNANFIRVS